MSFLRFGKRRNRSPEEIRGGRSSSRSSDKVGVDGSTRSSRSLSPFGRSARKAERRDESVECLRRETSRESEGENDSAPVVMPNNSFNDDDDDSSCSEEEEDDDRTLRNVGGGPREEEEDDPEFEVDEQLERNTMANTSRVSPGDFLSTEPSEMTYPGEGPNLFLTTDLKSLATSSNSAPSPLSPGNSNDPNGRATVRRRKSTKSKISNSVQLNVGRPVFEKNRCTVTLTHGDPDSVIASGKRTRKYLVASDLSDESLYAIQWAIGTVLREGDECTIVSVVETETKFDKDEAQASASDKKAKIVNQRERQANALVLSRQATALLERTSLNVRVHCQAIHAKNPRHMLLDMIDYMEPTMVIVGSRGLTGAKSILLGSVSNYLIQKSSSPVMCTRRPLRLSRTVHRKLSSLNREPRMPLSEAAIEKESQGGAVEDDEDEPKDIHEQVQKLTISEN